MGETTRKSSSPTSSNWPYASEEGRLAPIGRRYLIVSMDIHSDNHLVSRLEIVETGRRRRWSDAEKLRIVEESFSGPRLASATARRHGLSNQQLFAWRKAYREGCLGEVGGLVPAIVVAERPMTKAASDSGRIEIVTANGRRVIVDHSVDVEALLRIVQALERLA